MRLRKWTGRRGGLSLIEVLVGSALALLVLLPMLSSFIAGRMATSVARHHDQAMKLIQQRQEYLRSMGYEYVNTLSPNPMYESALTLDAAQGSPSGVSCTRTTHVTDLDADDLLEVTVTVTWTERTLGGEQCVSESIMTLFAPHQ